MKARNPREGERQLRVRTVRRNPPDVRRLAAALIELARAQAEVDAEVEHQRRGDRGRRGTGAPPTEKSA